MAEQDGAETSDTGPKENIEALRSLALRLLEARFPGDPDTKSKTRLNVGALPATFPTEIPIPDWCRVIGSLESGLLGVKVVLNSDQPEDRVLDFYRERMTASGWKILEVPTHGGFAGSMANQVTFCRGSRGPALTVDARALPNEPTDVDLLLQTDPRFSPCSQRQGMMHSDVPIPTLSPPPHSQHMKSSRGGGGTSWHSDASLETDLGLAPLADHYALQLEQAGWSRTGTGHDGPLAWSTWSFRGEGEEQWCGA
jgi:hypothetical protein